MTANQVFNSTSIDAIRCSHESIIPGLDCLQCKNCRRTWPSWHPDFNRLLNQSAVAPEQKSVLEQNKSVLEQTNCALVKSAPEQKQWLETYSPSTRRAYSYYRYVWMEGRKLSHIHIPGGNTESPIASRRATEVERWINLGRSPQKIQDLIKSWRKV